MVNNKGILSIIAAGLLASSLSVGTVKAEESDNNELSKRLLEGHVEKPLDKNLVDSELISKLKKDIANSKSTKSSISVHTKSSFEDDYIYEQEYNDEFAYADSTSYAKPTIGQLIPYYDIDFHKVVVPRDGLLAVGGETNSYAIDLFFSVTESNFAITGKLGYLGTEYEDGVEVQVYQAKKGTYYIPVFDLDDYYDNYEDDLYVIGTAFSDNVAPTKPTVNKVDNNDKVVKGKAEASSTVTVKVGSKTIGTAKATSSGNFTVNIPVQKAGTKLAVRAKDSAGNTSSATTTIVADVIPPSKPKINRVDSNDKSVKGTAEAYSRVIVKVGSKVIGTSNTNPKGVFAVKISPQKVGTTISVVTKDKAGNTSFTATTKVVRP